MYGLYILQIYILESPKIFEMDKDLSNNKIRGNSLYTIVDGPSWTDSEANANKLGGHLVTINNKEKYNLILDSYSTNDTF